MRQKLSLLLISALTCSSINAQSKVYGDFDGDGKKEYAYLVHPKTYINKDGDFVYEGMPKPAYTYIKFSKKSIPAIKIKDCIGGKLQNLGGMIGFLPIGILMVLGYSKMAHGVWYPSLWKYIV